MYLFLTKKALSSKTALKSPLNDSSSRLTGWDKENTFMYLDPPYFGCENVYSDIGEFGIAQHVLLSELLKESKSTWMLSYGDHAVIRDLYKDFHIKECTVKYSGLSNSGENQYDAPELIITNYVPPSETSLYDLILAKQDVPETS